MKRRLRLLLVFPRFVAKLHEPNEEQRRAAAWQDLPHRQEQDHPCDHEEVQQDLPILLINDSALSERVLARYCI